MNRPLGIPSVISKQYLFSAYYKEDKRISKLYPVKNFFFLSNNLRGMRPEDFDNPVMWRTSDSGEIRMMAPSGSIPSRVMKSQRKIWIPPVSLLSHTVASQENLAEANQNIAKLSLTSNLKAMDFKLVHIPLDLLQKPKDKPEDMNVPDEDAGYRVWYQRQVQNKMTGVIGGVLPRVRAIICYVCHEDLVDSEIAITKTDQSVFLESTFQKIEGYDLPGAVFSGNSESLPSGQYQLLIRPGEAARLSNKNWSQQTTETGEYTLTEFVRFPIRHPLYDIDVINCDPITVEEALFTQFPDHFAQYAHAARKAIREEKDSVVFSEKKTKEKPTKDPSKKTPNPHKGIEALCRQLIAKKQIVEAASNYLYSDYGSRKMFNIGLLVRRTFQAQGKSNMKMNQAADLIFSAFNSWEKVSNLLKSSSELLSKVKGETSKKMFLEALKKSSWGKIALLDATIDNYSGSLASKFKLPKWGGNIFNAMNTPFLALDAGLKGKVFLDAGHSWYTAGTSLKADLDGFQTMMADYQTHTAFLSESAEKGEFESIYFSPGSKAPPADATPLINKATAHLLSDSNHVIIIEGYTDSSGPEIYNLDLSLERAWGVKNKISALLAKEEKGLSDRILVDGLGESKAGEDGDDYSLKKKNRRCDLFFAKGAFEHLPSRTGIKNLEIQRNLTVSGLQQQDKKEKEAIVALFDAILGLSAVLPQTAPAAIFILSTWEIAKAGTALYKNAFAIVDEMLFDDFYKKLDELKKILKTNTSKSVSNHRLIHRELLEEKNKTPVYTDLMDSQLRIRAEGISGLLNLIQRAHVSVYDAFRNDKNKSDEAKKDEIVKKMNEAYKVDTYIQNFVLNDSWSYPLYHRNKIALDTYWLMVMNSHGREQDKEKKNGLTHRENFNVDKDDLLVSARRDRSEIAEKAASRGNHVHLSGSIAHSLPDNHITSGFSKSFPIHHLASESAENMMESFSPVKSYLSNNCYDYMNIYYRKRDENKDSDWKPLFSRKREGDARPWFAPLSPFDQIRVIVVLKPECDGIYSAVFQVNRYGGNQQGIRYKTLMAPLSNDELLKDEKYFVKDGQVGCVFFPFYQFQKRTVFGLKPMRHGIIESRIPLSYYEWSGGLKEMDYFITVEVGKNLATRRSVLWPKNAIHCQDLLEDPHREECTGFLLTVNRNRGHLIDPANISPYEKSALEKDYFKDDDGKYWVNDEGNLIVEDFLESLTSELQYGKLFSGKVFAVSLLKVGETPLLSTHSLFLPRLKRASSVAFPMELNHLNNLKIQGFDWKSPVSFTVIVSCDRIDGFKDYEKKGLNWKFLSSDLRMTLESSFFDKKGPSFRAVNGLRYLGEATIKGNWDLGKRDGLQVRFKPDILVAPWIDEPISTKDTLKTLVQWFLRAGGEHMKRYLINLLPEIKTSDGISFTDNPPIAENTTRHLFAAEFAISYQSLKGEWVNSVRPFGKILKPNDFYDFSLSISGPRGCGLEELVLSKRNQRNAKQVFSFQAPEDFNASDALWFKRPKDPRTEIEDQKRISLRSWVEDYAESVEAVRHSAF